MKQFWLSAFAAMVCALESADHLSFLNFITTHNKSYESVEDYEFRLAEFLKKDQIILANNDSGTSFKLSHNKMSDWTESEYKRILTHSAMPAND
jgi:hypothetical protein